MSSHPGVKKTLELLDRLQTTVRESAATEEKLVHEFRHKVGRDRQRRDETMQEDAARLTAEIAAEDAIYQSAKARVEAAYTRRKATISRARTSSKDQNLQKIETRSGSRKYKLQRQLMEAERTRDASLLAATTAFDEFNVRLADENALLEQLEQLARSSFRPFFPFVRLPVANQETNSAMPGEPDALMAYLTNLLNQAQSELNHFRKQPLAMLFRFLPVWVLLPLCATAIVLQNFGISSFATWTQQKALAVTGGAAFGMLVLYVVGLKLAKSPAAKIGGLISNARKLYVACLEKGAEHNREEIDRIQHEFTGGTQQIDAELSRINRDAGASRGSLRETIDDKTVRIAAKNDKRHRETVDAIEKEHSAKLAALRQAAELRRQESERLCAAQEAQVNDGLASRWTALETEWNEKLRSIYAAVADANTNAQRLFPPWSQSYFEHWKPTGKFEHAAKFGKLEVDVRQLCEVMPKDPRLALPGPEKFSAPLVLAYPEQGSILFETAGGARDRAIGSLNNIVLRLLATAPPGRLSFTIIDPVGLGQNFAGIMHLADYGEQLINSRIWTQPTQIEEKLADLNEHMEKVIQMYLRNEYETIAEYNEAAGNIAERYHILVVADFPVNFSEVATKRLVSIANSGARCGVYTLIHWDHRQPPPEHFVPEQLRKSSVTINGRGAEFMLTGKPMAGLAVSLDEPPTPELATTFIHQVGQSSRDSSRVEVPFSQVTPATSELWSEDTTSELRVPIGRTGATKLQYLAIGKGTRQHALIAGKTGSGKSTLFHVIITNLALWCSPEQVEFYLVDFKKGVEFKCYASKRLPHARVVAIESDREFGLSVLQRVDDELKRRGEMFRKLGVQDIAGYKRQGGKESVPRSLLLIDEFQELFVEDDKISQSASVLLDRIVRQGRAFGIHVVLGSQTLGGAYTVARTTLGQMVIRIALQCNEADAYLIMDDTNPAPRLLTRPGEGIYNDMAGAIEGNSPFQTVWLSDQTRDEYLDKVQQRALEGDTKYPGPLVYEGDAPADVRDNLLLQNLLAGSAVQPAASPHVWLGAPNSIKGPTEAVFHRQSGNHLLIVGQREEATLGIISLALISLAAQFPVGAAQFYVFDGSAPGSPQREYLECVVAMIPHEVKIVKPGDLTETMNALTEDLKKRSDEDHGAGAPRTFLMFNGLQKNNKLRHEEDFGFSADDSAASPGAQLNSLICEGASLGFHVIAGFDTYNNVNRFLSKKAFSEFEMRVLFQMSANDSASLSDSPKAGSLGLHRALFYNEQEGYLETFRPYALPDNEWLERAAANLKRLLPKATP